MKEIIYTEEFEKKRNLITEDKYYHNKENGTEIDMIDMDDVFMAGAFYVLDKTPKWKIAKEDMNIGALIIDTRQLVLYTDKVYKGDRYIALGDILKLDIEDDV